jgi:nicotinamidase-related amidase
MIWQIINSRRRRILIDISTQNDFFLAQGSACIRNHRRVLANIRRMMAWARRRNMPIISTSIVHPNDNGHSKFNYCLDGTEGQEKLSYTLLANRAVFEADGSTDLPVDILRRYKQVVLNKRCTDPFDEPRIERLLSEVSIGEFILIGATAEEAVKSTALGLLHRGKKVTIITDAIGYHDSKEAKLAFRKMEARGANLVETKKLAGTSHLVRVGACHCPMCQGKDEKVLVETASDN